MSLVTLSYTSHFKVFDVDVGTYSETLSYPFIYYMFVEQKLSFTTTYTNQQTIQIAHLHLVIVYRSSLFRMMHSLATLCFTNIVKDGTFSHDMRLFSF